MPAETIPLKLRPQRGFFETTRTDAWWSQPAAIFFGLLAFLIWANFRVFEGDHYYSGHSAANAATHYLTPFYSPLAFERPGKPPSHHAWLAHKPAWLPGFVSAAALILIFPAGFRFTCYYYRGSYYKAFWGDPPACAVGELRKTYWGEQYLPLILQNIHRYFLYAALVFIVILAYDVWHALWFHKLDAAGRPTGEWQLGLGLGTLLMALNVYLISGYTLGCHSLRHLIGGRKDCISESPTQQKLYNCVTCLNNRHAVWAWLSLFSVGFTDVYIRLLAMGVWTDWRIL